MDADRILIWKMKHSDTDAVEEFVKKYYSTNSFASACIPPQPWDAVGR